MLTRCKDTSEQTTEEIDQVNAFFAIFLALSRGQIDTHIVEGG